MLMSARKMAKQTRGCSDGLAWADFVIKQNAGQKSPQKMSQHNGRGKLAVGAKFHGDPRGSCRKTTQAA